MAASLPRTTSAREFSRLDALQNPTRDITRYALPPFTYQHEHEKVEQRWPAAVKFIKDNKINEFFDGEAKDIGIVMQGGMYNGVLRAMEIMGLADVYGNSRIPLYVLNATYPLVDDEFVEFCAGKKAIMVVEEGQPEFIEQAIYTMLRRKDIQTRVEGKSVLPMAGEYTGSVLKAGLQKFCTTHRPDLLTPDEPPQTNKSLPAALGNARHQCAGPSAVLLHRLSGAPDLFGDEARPARGRAAACQRRYRLPHLRIAAAVQHRPDHDGLWPWRCRCVAVVGAGRQAPGGRGR